MQSLLFQFTTAEYSTLLEITDCVPSAKVLIYLVHSFFCTFTKVSVEGWIRRTHQRSLFAHTRYYLVLNLQ